MMYVAFVIIKNVFMLKNITIHVRHCKLWPHKPQYTRRCYTRACNRTPSSLSL